MSTILHPCLESQFIETAKVLKLKVGAVPKSMEFGRSSIENRDEFNQLKIKKVSSNTTEHGGWTFLQAISNTSKETILEKENNIYIHPLSKYASPRLSEKSLQLCTENLGCETGSFMMDTNILSLTSYNYSMEENPARKEQEQEQSPKQMEGEGYSCSIKMKKVKSSRELPPPLTTMSGEKSLQVKTHRKDGRLIIQAIEKPLKESCFIADRSDGRLRLCFLKDFFTKVDMQMSPEGNEAADKDEDIKNENEIMNKDDEQGENEEFQNQGNDDFKEIMYNNDIDVENMGKEKFQRLGRCKECGNSKKKLCNWEPLWVATS